MTKKRSDWFKRNVQWIAAIIIPLVLSGSFVWWGITQNNAGASNIRLINLEECQKKTEQEVSNIKDTIHITQIRTINLLYEIRDTVNVGNREIREFKDKTMRMFQRQAEGNASWQKSFQDIFNKVRIQYTGNRYIPDTNYITNK